MAWATQAGLVPPSTSTVRSAVNCTAPPSPTGSAAAMTAASLIFAPTGTGAGKRTLFSP